MESTHAGQKYDGVDLVFSPKERVGGRPKSKHLNEYIEATEVIYESTTPTMTYEIDEEQVGVLSSRFCEPLGTVSSIGRSLPLSLSLCSLLPKLHS